MQGVQQILTALGSGHVLAVAVMIVLGSSRCAVDDIEPKKTSETLISQTNLNTSGCNIARIDPEPGPATAHEIVLMGAGISAAHVTSEGEPLTCEATTNGLTCDFPASAAGEYQILATCGSAGSELYASATHSIVDNDCTETPCSKSGDVRVGGKIAVSDSVTLCDAKAISAQGGVTDTPYTVAGYTVSFCGLNDFTKLSAWTPKKADLTRGNITFTASTQFKTSKTQSAAGAASLTTNSGGGDTPSSLVGITQWLFHYMEECASDTSSTFEAFLCKAVEITAAVTISLAGADYSPINTGFFSWLIPTSTLKSLVGCSYFFAADGNITFQNTGALFDLTACEAGSVIVLSALGTVTGLTTAGQLMSATDQTSDKHFVIIAVPNGSSSALAQSLDQQSMSNDNIVFLDSGSLANLFPIKLLALLRSLIGG